MLVIRDEQMTALADMLRRSFRDDLVHAFALRLGENRPMRAAELGRRVDAAIAEAGPLGLVLDVQIEQLAWAFVSHGADLGAIPWARAIFHDPGLTPDEKLALIQAGLPGGDVP
jgi:hypothetical protein